MKIRLHYWELTYFRTGIFSLDIKSAWFKEAFPPSSSCFPAYKGQEPVYCPASEASFCGSGLFSNVEYVLISLFNGISTFADYLMPKHSSLKNSSGTI